MSHIQPDTHIPQPKVYKPYTSILSQTDVDNPTEIILLNTLNTQITWIRTGVGIYEGRITTHLFKPDKTIANVLSNSSTGPTILKCTIYAYVSNDNTIQINTTDTAGDLSDDILNNTPIEIKVYS